MPPIPLSPAHELVAESTLVVAGRRRRGGRRAVPRHERRRAILEATVELSVLVGGEHLTARGICAHVPVTPAMFYDHFDNVAQALGEACLEIDRDLREAVLDAAVSSAGQDTRGRIEACLTAITEFLAEDPVRAEAVLVQSHVAGSTVAEARASTFGWLARLVDGALQDHAAPAGGRELTTWMALGGIHERLYTAVVAGEAFALPGQVGVLTDLLLLPYEWPAGRPIAARRG